jgi:hypothetical protein
VGYHYTKKNYCFESMDTAKYHRIIRGRQEGVGSSLLEEIGDNDKVYEEQQRKER